MTQFIHSCINKTGMYNIEMLYLFPCSPLQTVWYPDQARQDDGPDLDPKLFDTLIVFTEIIFRKS